MTLELFVNCFLSLHERQKAENKQSLVHHRISNRKTHDRSRAIPDVRMESLNSGKLRIINPQREATSSLDRKRLMSNRRQRLMSNLRSKVRFDVELR